MALVGAALALVLVGGGCAKDADEPIVFESAGGEGKLTVEEVAIFTMDQVAAHNTEDDCWMAVDGKVYDGARAASFHAKLKDKFVALCGTDATGAFMTRGQEPPNPHPESASSVLESIYLGDLVE